MIKLTRIQGEVVYINENNIQWIECNPDTTITFINGYRFIVKEKIEDILELLKNSNLPPEIKLNEDQSFFNH